jgi:probable HAF family extracellular repeat protein
MNLLRHALSGVTSAAALAAAALPAATQADSPPPPGYVVYDTTTLGGTFAFGSSVNNLGWVAGASLNVAGGLHASLSIPGNVIDLGTLGGTNSAVEWPVKNNHGIVAGISESATPDPHGETFSCADFIPTNGHTCLPFLWQNGSIAALPLLGGNNGFATGVNNAGLAVGWAETAAVDPTCVPPQVLQFLAVEWGPGLGPKRVLPPWGTDSTSAATAINDAGEVVGISGDCDVAVGAFSARDAVLWVNAHPVRLPTLGGKGWNTPMALSNSGIIVGFSDTPGDDVNGVLTPNNQAVLWTPQGIVNLHTLPGDATAQATGVNDFGQIVGTSFAGTDSGASRVFLWQGGQMYDLNTLLQPNAPLYLVGSGDINDRGEITGIGCLVAVPGCAVLHTFVAIPVSAAGGHGPDASQSAARPYLPAEVGERSLSRLRFGHMQPERDRAQ